MFYAQGFAVVPYFNGFAAFNQKTGMLASDVFYPKKDENAAENEARVFQWLAKAEAVRLIFSALIG